MPDCITTGDPPPFPHNLGNLPTVSEGPEADNHEQTLQHAPYPGGRGMRVDTAGATSTVVPPPSINPHPSIGGVHGTHLDNQLAVSLFQARWLDESGLMVYLSEALKVGTSCLRLSCLGGCMWCLS